MLDRGKVISALSPLPSGRRPTEGSIADARSFFVGILIKQPSLDSSLSITPGSCSVGKLFNVVGKKLSGIENLDLSV